MHNTGFLIARIFFGLWLIRLGYLAYGSGMFLRALRAVLIVVGLSYLLDTLAQFLAPGARKIVHRFLAIPRAIAIGEIWMVAYLLVNGVKPPLSARRASALADRATVAAQRKRE
jgi:Domain of unknown function (DUF4386)